MLLIEDIREHEAVHVFEDHPSASDTSRVIFLHSTELRNETAQLSQDRTLFRVLTIFERQTFLDIGCVTFLYLIKDNDIHRLS